MMDDRYYVQCLTAQIFLIRERISVDSKPGSNDRLVRAFDARHDADVFARCVNEKQMQLDELYGHWVQHAL